MVVPDIKIYKCSAFQTGATSPIGPMLFPIAAYGGLDGTPGAMHPACLIQSSHQWCLQISGHMGTQP